MKKNFKIENITVTQKIQLKKEIKENVQKKQGL